MTTYVVLNDSLGVIAGLLARCGYKHVRGLLAGAYDLEYVRGFCAKNIPGCEQVHIEALTPGVPQGVILLYTVANINERQTLRTEIGYVAPGWEVA